MDKKILLEGRCGCGQTTWKSTTLATHLDFCYCTQCQQVTGSPFGAWLGIKRDSITWEGPTAKYRLSDIATRSLCVNCGGTLSIQYDCYPNKTHVAAGTVTKGAELLPPKPSTHIFVRSKPVWYGIPENDGVERWDGFDDDFVKLLRDYNLQMGRNDENYDPKVHT